MKQIHKHDIVATIGFLGNTALVNKKLRNTLKKKTIEQLLDEGYIKEALCWTLFEKNEQYKNIIADFLKQNNYTESFDFLCREYGIDESIFEKIQKVKRI